MIGKEQLRFGPYSVDVANRRLLREGKEIAIEARPFDVLLCLLRRASRLVTNEEILQEVWGEDVHVEQGQVSTCVRKIRRALGDDAREPKYVATVVRYGYRFIAETRTEAIGGDVAPIVEADSEAGGFAAEARSGTSAAGGLVGGPSRPNLLIGREREIEDLAKSVSRPANSPVAPRLTIVRGLPGVGKTTLAGAFVHREETARLFPDGLLWSSLGQEPDLLSELKMWASALLTDDLSAESRLEIVRRRLAMRLAGKRALMVLDDVWDAGVARAMVLGGEGCAVLITTRVPEVADALALIDTHVIQLGVLSEESAVELLVRLAPAIDHHREQAALLAQSLEHLPLALQVAGRLLRAESRHGWGVEELITELQEAATMMGERAPSDMADLMRQTTPTVAALLKRSTDCLEPEARECFAYLAALAPKPATFDLGALQAIWEGMADAKGMTRMLVRRGLLEPVGGGRFWVHALLVAHARSLLPDDMAAGSAGAARDQGAT